MAVGGGGIGGPNIGGTGIGGSGITDGGIAFDLANNPGAYIKAGTGPTSSVAFYPTSGNWVQETDNVPHSIYSHDLGREIGIPIFGSFSNKALHSQALDNGAYVKNALLVAANDRVAPDGSTTADLCTASGAGGASIGQNITCTNAAQQLLSCFGRFVDNRWLASRNAGFTGLPRSFHDIENGVNGTGEDAAIDSLGIIDAGGGWYNFFSSTTSTDTSAVAETHLATADGTLGTPANGQDVHLWGFQYFDDPPFSVPPPLYIPTTTAEVTRTADNPQLRDDLVQNVSGEFILAARLHLPYLSQGSTRVIASIHNGTTAERVEVRVTNADQFSFLVVAGNVNQGSVSLNPSGAGEHVVAVRKQAGNYTIWLDGVKGGTDTGSSLPLSPTTMDLGQRFQSTAHLNGMIESIIVSRDLSDANGLAMSQL